MKRDITEGENTLVDEAASTRKHHQYSKDGSLKKSDRLFSQVHLGLSVNFPAGNVCEKLSKHFE